MSTAKVIYEIFRFLFFFFLAFSCYCLVAGLISVTDGSMENKEDNPLSNLFLRVKAYL